MVEIKVVGTFATFAMLCQPPPTQTIAHHVASHSKIKLYYECMLQVYVASVYFKCVQCCYAQKVALHVAAMLLCTGVHAHTKKHRKPRQKEMIVLLVHTCNQ